MAHRVQHPPVRRARNAADGGVRALRRTAGLIAALGALLSCGAAHAQSLSRDQLLATGLTDVPAWWSEPGAPGWTPDADIVTGSFWVLAGHVRGGWSLREHNRPPLGRPFPGALTAQTQLSWLDTLEVTRLEGAGWEGFGASLASIATDSERGLVAPAGLRDRSRSRAWTDVALIGGSAGDNDNALSFRRADSLRWVRVEVESFQRDPVASLGDAARHLYDVGGGFTRGAHSVEATFGQRGTTGHLRGGESQSARAESGRIGYAYEAGPRRFGLALERGYDMHESSTLILPLERRDTQEDRAVAEFEDRGGGGLVGARFAFSRARVARSPETSLTSPVVANAGWGAVRWKRPYGDGELNAELGIGGETVIGDWQWAPALAYRFAGGPFHGRIAIARLLQPVWSDLAAGQEAFLQHTWAGDLELAAGKGAGLSGMLDFLAGHTRDRAIVTRLPLEAIAMRSGFRADPSAFDFGLFTGSARWRSARWAAGVEGFALARDESGIEPRLDPASGARVYLEHALTLFKGDLGVRAHVEASSVGARESEALRRLPAFATLAARLELQLADARLVFEGRNLANRHDPAVWVDSSTGIEAETVGLEVRTAFTWRLWN